MPHIRKKSQKTAGEIRWDVGLLTEKSEVASAPERATILRWFAAQAETTQCEIFAKHGSLLHEKREPGQPVSAELSLACLVLAAKIVRREELALSAKESLQASQADGVSRRRLDKLKVQRRTKSAPKSERIRKEFFHLIGELVESGNSWSMIALYLSRYHKFPITHGYLYNEYQKIKKELEG